MWCGSKELDWTEGMAREGGPADNYCSYHSLLHSILHFPSLSLGFRPKKFKTAGPSQPPFLRPPAVSLSKVYSFPNN
jgi:hypothetical protein